MGRSKFVELYSNCHIRAYFTSEATQFVGESKHSPLCRCLLRGGYRGNYMFTAIPFDNDIGSPGGSFGGGRLGTPLWLRIRLWLRQARQRLHVASVKSYRLPSMLWVSGDLDDGLGSLEATRLPAIRQR